MHDNREYTGFMHRMKKDLHKVQQDLLERQAKPVKLRVASSIAHYELTGRKREAYKAQEYFAAVAEVAAQLVQVADVYYINEAGRLLRVPSEDVAAGKVINGGDVLAMPNGFTYRGLSMRRSDVMDGIAALKGARALMSSQEAKTQA